MSTPTFGTLLANYMLRAGISDSELARTIGVQRQTIFRWKEGLVARPRVREDVLRCASKLRLTREERDQLLLAAGFPPEVLPVPTADAEPLTDTIAPVPLPQAAPPAEEREAADAGLSSHAAPRVELTLPTSRQISWSRWAGVVLAALALVSIWLLWQGRAEPTLLPVATPTAALSFTVNETAVPITSTPSLLVNHPLSATTPLALALADAGELRLVVAQFTGYSDEKFNVAGRIGEELERQIDKLKLTQARVQIWPDAIRTAGQARQVMTDTRSVMVIWGEYDSGRVQVNWFTPDSQKAEQRDFSLTSPQELLVTINKDLPKEVQILAFYTLGGLLQTRQENDQAIPVYQEALALDPSDKRLAARMNFNLGRIFSSKVQTGTAQVQNYDAGLRYYTAAYKLNPRLYNALYNRGTVWLNRALIASNPTEAASNLSEAIADLTELLGYKPDFADGYYNRGLAYYHRNQPADLTQAIADFTQVTTLKPEKHEGWYQRALLRIRAGEDLRWPADLTRTVELAPDYYQVYDAFCWGYALAQQPETALPYCTQAQATQPAREDGTRTNHDSLGIIYAQLGRYAEAVAELEQYLAWVKTHHPQNYKERRGPEVERWIAVLRTQKNPFDKETLNGLR